MTILLDLKNLYVEIHNNDSELKKSEILNQIYEKKITIQNYDFDGLVLCLNSLSNPLIKKFLLVIWKDLLSEIIKSSYELSYILSYIKNDNLKILFIKELNKDYFNKLLFNADDLILILKMIFLSTNQNKLLKYLWKKKLIDIFSNSNEIKMVLHFLLQENKDLLLEYIWLDWVKWKVKNSEDFRKFFKELTPNYSIKFLSLYSKEELKTFFIDNNDFYNFLLKLQPEKTKLILQKII